MHFDGLFTMFGVLGLCVCRVVVTAGTVLVVTVSIIEPTSITSLLLLISGATTHRSGRL